MQDPFLGTTRAKGIKKDDVIVISSLARVDCRLVNFVLCNSQSHLCIDLTLSKDESINLPS